MAIAPPLEDKGPLSGSYLLVQDTRDTRLPLRKVQRLGQDIRQLGRCRNANEHHCHLAILDHFVRKVFPDVDVLGTLPSADDVVPPLDARGVVLVHRSRGLLGKAHMFEEVAKVEHLRSCRRSRVVLRFRRR